MKKPTPVQAWVGLLITTLTAISGFLGWDKYEQTQAATTITIEAPKAEHSHGTVVSQNDINQIVRNAIADAIKQQDRKNQELFKKKEIWD